MALIGLATDADHAAAIYAYTEESDHNLYGKLNFACRTLGGVAERQLAVYLNYLHHLSEATRVDRGSNAGPSLPALPAPCRFD